MLNKVWGNVVILLGNRWCWPAGRFSKALYFGSPMELDIVETWGINTRVSPGSSVQECYWFPPPHMVMKVNTDGVATGMAGIGFVFRDHDCNTVMVGCQQIGVENCFFAECLAILTAMEVRCSCKGLDKALGGDRFASNIRSFCEFPGSMEIGS
ncbi:hypothetical protein FRX31_017736 [Thalictrum thalictroides]|uniref:RNase H type-1 domain-containing protein n=1 Tax=Thalictrum thalictroides TaxID=46969 RepID=A0A7J6W6Z9_THATH|nr:hypothetical protein FRX31_017736 [Thalictrum thalictroides]